MTDADNVSSPAIRIKPPFTLEMARAKVKAAENAWNSRDPEIVAQGYTVDGIARMERTLGVRRGTTEPAPRYERQRLSHQGIGAPLLTVMDFKRTGRSDKTHRRIPPVKLTWHTCGTPTEKET
jgi:Protein of unknown function (DUF1348)